jgi:hypothetical protein
MMLSCVLYLEVEVLFNMFLVHPSKILFMNGYFRSSNDRRVMYNLASAIHTPSSTVYSKRNAG